MCVNKLKHSLKIHKLVKSQGIIADKTNRGKMSSVPYVTFNNGNKMPGIGFGTYQATKGVAEEAVKNAIDVGYRHIDTAAFYGNEKEVGVAIQAKISEGIVKREDIFLTTKVWNNSHEEQNVVKSCKESLQKLNIGYIDLLLIHWPFAYEEGSELTPVNEKGEILTSNVDYLETWRGMEECYRQGMTRNIGISNFNSEQITRLLGAAKIKPVNNQVEVNLNINQQKLIEFCKKHKITVTGYCPLGQPGNRSKVDNQFDNPKVQEIAKKYGKSPAQISLRFVYQQGAAPIPKSAHKSRMEENLNIFDFELSEDEMKILRTLENGQRVAGFYQLAKHKYYPFSAPF